MIPDVRHALCICWIVLSRAELICNHVVLACLWQEPKCHAGKLTQNVTWLKHCLAAEHIQHTWNEQQPYSTSRND